MRCLSFIQPFADLVVAGKKTIELRKWNTHFRGEFLVHASKKTDVAACTANNIDKDTLVHGAVVGKALLYDVKIYTDVDAFERDKHKHLASFNQFGSSKYGFMLKDAVKFKTPMPMKGKLNFFEAEIGAGP
jgi:hypothetical protein